MKLARTLATAALALGMVFVTVPSASAGGKSRTCNSTEYCVLSGSGFPGYTGHVDIDAIGGEHNALVHWVFKTDLRRCEGDVRIGDPASSWTCKNMSAPHPGNYTVIVTSAYRYDRVKVGLRW
ncbi:hypothetical protein [Allokutzneria albata]|uniref:Peptidase inhibitor family I36 n=1 Tax=Allokutzneria albata TaxID=211114 RepID=A0A1G9YW29_ALLAB|nr:hypothetical protein [Allokutzneria albata]SDN13359.1 hypothetical protein SAMN04489726_5092 [Allokutzneria albata]